MSREDIEQDRAVALHNGIMMETLSKLYGAQKLLDEMLSRDQKNPRGASPEGSAASWLSLGGKG